jgi:hypothetical protein
MSQTSGETQSEAPPGQGLPVVLCRVAAGLDTGLVGALALLAWFAAGSHFGGGLWFSRFNLAAAPFYGDLVFDSGAGWHTVVGVAHLLLIYSLLGAAYGLLPASREGWLNLMTALGFAGLIHLCADAWLWKRLHPFAHPYYAPLAIAPGHLIYGFFLWRFPSRLKRLTLLLGGRDALASLAPAPTPPEVEAFAPPESDVAPGTEDKQAKLDSAPDPSFDIQDDAPAGPETGSDPERRGPESSRSDGSPPPSSLE